MNLTRYYGERGEVRVEERVHLEKQREDTQRTAGLPKRVKTDQARSAGEACTTGEEKKSRRASQEEQATTTQLVEDQEGEGQLGEGPTGTRRRRRCNREEQRKRAREDAAPPERAGHGLVSMEMDGS